MRLKDVRQKRLVHPRAPDGAARVAHHGVENLEPAPPGHGEPRALDLAEHRRLRARLERSNRLHPAAIFVAEWKAIEQVFDGDEAGALEVRAFARTYAFQELQR